MDHAWEFAMERERGYHLLPRLNDKHVVTLGGGTGPFALLSTLKHYPSSTTAIVTMADSGGSSRRLMDEFGQLPLGDLRQALVALSRKGVLWRDVFTFRFHKRQAPCAAETPRTSNGAHAQKMADQAGVSGHSLGNLIISALENLNDGNLLQAVADAQELLDTAGNVLPVTLTHTTLCAELADGAVICGETDIDTRGEDHYGQLVPVRRVYLREETPPCAEAIRAIRRADVIVIGPGDLYTSILPNLLVQGVADAIRSSEAQKVYICNLMTKHGETDDFRASDFVREIHRYLGSRVDRVILHDGSFPEHLLGRYAAKQQRPVEPDTEQVQRLVPDVIVDPFLAVHGDHLVRHDADRLVRAIFAPPAGTLSQLAPLSARWETEIGYYPK
jgi:uncharacterized cofD-like protein